MAYGKGTGLSGKGAGLTKVAKIIEIDVFKYFKLSIFTKLCIKNYPSSNASMGLVGTVGEDLALEI